MKYTIQLFFYFLTIQCTTLIQCVPNGFYLFKSEDKTALVFINIPTNTDSPHADYTIFNASAFDVPHALEYAREKAMPFILIIPDVFLNVSQLDANAPWLEGARVALAWASAFFRFNILGNVDVRVLQIDASIQQPLLSHALNILIDKKIDDSQDTPEKNIDARIFRVDDLLYTPLQEFRQSSLEHITIPQCVIPTTTIEPTLKLCVKNQKRFLVTGAAGFIGSHLVNALLQQGHQVIGLDNFLCCSGDNIKEFKNNPHFYFHKHDITLPFTIVGPVDSIIHLASVPSPAFYYALPIETLRTGLHGTKNCLDLALQKKAQFVFASTSEVYGDPEITPQPEDYCGRVSPIGKRSQYDMSKRGAETLIKLYFDTNAIDIRVARIFNTYGPGMLLNDGRVVTNFIQAVLQQKSMHIYGNGQQTRSFAYVSDTVGGILQLVMTETITPNTDLKNRIFNIGNPIEFTIDELAQHLNAIAHEFCLDRADVINIPQFDTTDPKMRCPDITRAKRILHFAPAISLDNGLKKTLDYFLNQPVKNLYFRVKPPKINLNMNVLM